MSYFRLLYELTSDGDDVESFSILLALENISCYLFVLQSETCDVRIPELDFEMCAGTFGGKFTTVEGLLVNFKEQVPYIVYLI